MNALKMELTEASRINMYICSPIKGIKMIKTFKYDKPLGRMIFNYNKFTKKLINDAEKCVYYCGENFYTDYVDTNHGHILTGNLNIVTDLVLWGYLLHGTKYRLRRVIARNHAFKRLENNIDFFYIQGSRKSII